MKKLIFLIMLLFVYSCVDVVLAQDSPTSTTTNYGFGKWAQSANPGATGLNDNWDDIDTEIDVGRDSAKVLYGWFLADHTSSGVHEAGVIEWTMLSSAARANMVTIGDAQVISGSKVWTGGITFSGAGSSFHPPEYAGTSTGTTEGNLFYNNPTNELVYITSSSTKDTAASKDYARSLYSGSYVALAGGGTVTSGDITVNDNVEIYVGTGNDLKFYASGTSGYMDIKEDGNFTITSQQEETSFVVTSAGIVQLYYGQGVLALATASTGIEVTGDIDVSDDIRVTDDLTVSGNSDVEDATIYGYNAYTLTAAEFAANTLDATNVTYYDLEDYTSAVSITDISGGIQGQILYLCGGSSISNAITFTDAASPVTDQLALSGDFVMGSNDALTLIFNGTYWKQLSESNN